MWSRCSSAAGGVRWRAGSWSCSSNSPSTSSTWASRSGSGGLSRRSRRPGGHLGWPEGCSLRLTFSFFALIQLVTTYLLRHDAVAASAVSTVDVVDWAMRILAGVFAILTGVYAGFLMTYCKSIPFWNTGLLPIIFVVDGIADGLALVMGIGLTGRESTWPSWKRPPVLPLILNALLITTYLVNASYQSVTAGQSVRELVAGRIAAVFWVGVVLLGITIPLAISIVSLFAGRAYPATARDRRRLPHGRHLRTQVQCAESRLLQAASSQGIRSLVGIYLRDGER